MIAPITDPPKKRRTRATIGAAATKLVEAVLRVRVDDVTRRSAEILSLALDRDGDAASAAAIREAIDNRGGAAQFVSRQPAGSSSGEWYMPAMACDDLVLDAAARARFDRLLAELAEAPRFIAAGIDAPTRVFFDGPSGTGKTLAAKHLARRLGLPLLLGRIDRVVDSHMGESSKKIAGLFEAALAVPCVVFLDEIDAIVGPRGGDMSASDREAARTTSTLLQQLDLLPPVQLVIVASNFHGEIDAALSRRFPTRVTFAAPNADARLAMLRYWWRNVAIAETQVAEFVTASEGMSGADLRAKAMELARSFIMERDEISSTRSDDEDAG